MKVSDYIVSFLAEKGIDTVFGYIGGMITHIVDSLGKSEQVKYIQTYHEQTAAIAAEGYAIGCDKFGVAVCTSGPGVTNMMTGIADAYFGSIPVIFISGQVNTYEYKYDKPVRQQGFQEMEVVNVVKPITKYAVLLDKPEDIRYELEKAVYIATHGRKGPVVIDLPMNISRAEIEPEKLRGYEPEVGASSVIPINEIRELIEGAKRPMILVGAGCYGENVGRMLDQYLVKTNIPVVTSLMGRGIIDETYPHYVGMIGSYGNRCANMSVAKADLLIALGSRMDTRQTGAMYREFLREGKIIHVDLDKNELDYHRLTNRLKVYASVADFLKVLTDASVNYQDYTIWNTWIDKIKENYSQDKEIERFVENRAPYQLLQRLNEISKEGDVFTVDVGQNQMWSAQTLKLKKGQRFVNSGGLAPMGFAMPVAIGIAFANPKKTIYCVTGDGGFHMAIQSMLTIAQYNLNIKVIVINNAALGMITQFQHLYFDDRMYGTTKAGGFINPDLKNLAKAYDMRYAEYTSDSLNEFDAEGGPGLVNYLVRGLTTVSPKLEYNKPIDRPSPQLPETEYNCIAKLLANI
jgi:acetolactate synthase-1/2/3 large subunit